MFGDIVVVDAIDDISLRFIEEKYFSKNIS